MHVPTDTRVTVVPETVHTAVVCELKDTVRPEVEVAVTLNGDVPKDLFDRVPKVTVWLAWVTWKLWMTGMAAAYVALPAWVAWTVHVPTATRVTVVPERLHTPVVCELNDTVRPDVAVALTLNADVPKDLFDRAPKVMVWVRFVTWKLWLTDGAAR